MDVEDLKRRLSNTVDQWFDQYRPEQESSVGNDNGGTEEQKAEEARVLPEGKRVVRTTSSGDRVYLLDDVKKTRAWVINPDVLDSLGFELRDVGEVTEDEMLKFQMAPALHKRVDG